jgi:hypothetical protein
MNSLPKLGLVTRLLGLALPLALVACGGTSTSLSGTAATGAPVAGGTVNVKCAGGPAQSTTTADAGTWQVSMAGQTLPCKVKVSGGNLASGQAFHSMAVDLGTVNITPVTDLVVANLATRAPGTWFDDDSPAEFQKISKTSVDAALAKVREALPTLGTLATVNPLTASFKAEKGDALDNVLEAIKTAIPDYSALLIAAQGAGFKAYAETYAGALSTALASAASSGSSGSGGTSSGGFTCKIAASQLRSPTAQEFALYVKTYSGDVGTGSTYSSASAELKADGQFVVNGKSYAPSSYCFDTVIGATDYGNTLYVNFPEGKADLWQKNSQHATQLNAPGTGNLVLAIKVNGINAPSVSITGVPKPANQSEFCSGVGSSSSPTSLSNALGAVGSFTINSCTFANNVGTVSATLTITSPISLSTPYSVTYTYE